MAGEPGTPRAPWARAVRARPGALSCLGIALLALALYAPYLGAEELHFEEGRRALPAREMLESGDYLLPSIWGRAYLAKPPLLYWCIAACAQLRGAVDEVATRLPSLLSTLGTALLVLILGARWFSRRAGLMAALCWLLSPAVFNKGTLGELEALLALAVLGSLCCLPATAAGSSAAALSCGLCLAAALLTKGPPALVFVAAAVIALARVEGARRLLRQPRVLIALGLGLALAGTWLALLLSRLDVAQTLAYWRQELDRTGGANLRELFGDRLSFALAFPGGVLAASLCAFVVAGRAGWRELRGQSAFDWMLGTLVLSLAFLFLFAPRHRYAYPMTPLAALIGGALLDARCSLDAGRATSLAQRTLARTFAVAGLLLGTSLIPALRAAAGLEFHPDVLGWAAALGGVAAGVWLWRAAARAPLAHLGLCAAAVLVALRLLIATQYDPPRAERRGYRETARRIETLVPQGETLHTSQWMHFNELSYVRRPVRAVADLGQLERGDLAFVRDPSPESSRGFRVLGEVPLGAQARGVVLRRRGPRADPKPR